MVHGRFRVLARSKSLLFWNTNNRGRSSSLSGLFGSNVDDNEDEGVENDERASLIDNYIINPRKTHLQRITETWHSRLLALVIFPSFVTLLWCAIPLSIYDLLGGTAADGPDKDARINIWQFLLIYYGFYTAIGTLLLLFAPLTYRAGLLWITKLFNLYAVNW